MASRRYFACPVCAEEFALPAASVRRRERATSCPCCGTIDVIDLGVSFGSDDDELEALFLEAS